MKGVMKGRYRLECDCGEDSLFIVAAREEGLEVELAAHGCLCEDRPSEVEALEKATHEFTERLEAREWEALYRHSAEV